MCIRDRVCFNGGCTVIFCHPERSEGSRFMAHVSLYRKYRPETFDQVKGQEHVTRTLVNAIESGKISHAYLFAGSRGTGKTSTAKLLAKALNCCLLYTSPSPRD